MPKQENLLTRLGKAALHGLYRALASLGRLTSSIDASATVYWRVRVAMYTVLLVVGAWSAWQALQVEESEAVRLADAEIIQLAAQQSTLSQRMGMLAALLALGDGRQEEYRRALGETISQSQLQAPRLEELLNRQGVWQSGAAPALRQSVYEWQDRRERLWYRAQLLVLSSDRLDSVRLLGAIKALRNEVDSSLLNSQTLVQQVQMAVQLRAGSAVGQIKLSALLMILLLLGLTLGVAEPLARFVKRQYQSLLEQSQELKRLSLVAERTSNWVAVLDAQRHIVWCNKAFLNARGSTPEQLVGEPDGLIVPSRHNNHDEMRRLSTELDRGLGVRVEVHTLVGQGQDIWLDVDYQPIHAEGDSITGFTIVAADVSERVNQRLKMNALLDALPVGVILLSASGGVIECNQAAAQLLGQSRDELIGRNRLSSDGATVREDMTLYPVGERPSARTLRTGQGLRGESVGQLSPEGELRWLLVNTEPMRDAAGQMAGVVWCAVDVTVQREQQQLLTLAVESASLGIWQWDIASGTMSCNDRLLELNGHERGTLGMHVSDWNAAIHPDDLGGWVFAIRSNLKNSRQPLHREIRIRHGRSGRWVWRMYSGTVVARDADGQALRVAGICYDINAQKELEEQLRQSARTDSLTRLPNRSVLLSRIQTSIERSRAQPSYCFAVLFMDFDRFKQVNDTLGHAAGDELLRQIASRLEESLRPSDAFVQTSNFSQLAARIGGDEFVVLLDDIRGDLDAQLVASRLLDVLAQPYQIDEHLVNSSVSIGIVTTEHMADDPDSVLRDADIAMYEAKRQGRGRYEMFIPMMRKRLHDDVALENDLRTALEMGELSVVYQPVIDLADGRLDGMEALTRWLHPQRGLVSPLIFIPIAEASGLIAQLGLYVLRAACDEFLRLRETLGDLAPKTISVNLSRAQLRQSDFITQLSDVLYASGVAPGQLILEVTESLAAQDEQVQATLNEIRTLGVRLSLDDFGTGYSSLSCLHELPVNVVKIDRSFVSQALGSDYHRVMIEATIRMAQTLGLGTVAEGIETRDQAALMKSLGCDKGQGYLYSRPLTAKDMEQWARALGT